MLRTITAVAVCLLLGGCFGSDEPIGPIGAAIEARTVISMLPAVPNVSYGDAGRPEQKIVHVRFEKSDGSIGEGAFRVYRTPAGLVVELAPVPALLLNSLTYGYLKIEGGRPEFYFASMKFINGPDTPAFKEAVAAVRARHTVAVPQAGAVLPYNKPKSLADVAQAYETLIAAGLRPFDFSKVKL